ncbi:hypothetical protein E2L06_18120 [Haloterrigena sp. H1]|nr:hypothetical protein E2L06_21025 [Haloterrigena sp. H1]TMT81769.1 hypothetical protein E2L06_17855 [Haloterrigena sp. H1]TMT81813.1 hypothetical protein E2L06_18120 [Haloterrigena sp. H1]
MKRLCEVPETSHIARRRPNPLKSAIQSAEGVGIQQSNNMDTLRACIAYENQHQQRVPILRLLEKRANELRSQDKDD